MSKVNLLGVYVSETYMHEFEARQVEAARSFERTNLLGFLIGLATLAAISLPVLASAIF